MRVQDHYAKYVTSGGDGLTVLEGRAADLGYQKKVLGEDSDLLEARLFRASCGSGCPLRLPGGRPLPTDRLVVDLGCGAGHDVLLAASLLQEGKTIGIDVTPEMVAAAQTNLKRHPELASRVEFLQADFADPDAPFVSRFLGQVDLILSNGVFNLCEDKAKAFELAHRLLRPGGRLVFSDVLKLEDKDVDPNATIATSINGDVFSS